MNKRLIFSVMLSLLLSSMTWGIMKAPVAAQGAWHAEYFANRYLTGAPALTRFDADLHFEWGGGSPGAGVPNDNFSARWTRLEWFDVGTYRFSYRSDDGIRIWVDDNLVVDDWRDRQATWSSINRVIPKGVHVVQVEYYERVGAATVQVAWEKTSGGNAWRAEYFDNRDRLGAPIMVRYDPAIDFDWGSGSPSVAVPADDFSVRWTRTMGFNAGTYRFFASCDDGVRVYVDGVRVVDAWYNQKLPNTRWGEITLSGEQHTVIVEYFERGGDASAHVWWNLLSAFGKWEGRYYANAELRGGPDLVRDDAAIDFDWSEGAPADWMPTDDFSVVWTRQVNFSPGYYRLFIQSDDGMRVWLDGALVMDYWHPMDNEQHYLNWTYLDGVHDLKVEYFERTGYARARFWWEKQGATEEASGSAPSSTCDGGPLRLDAWPVNKVCRGDGWTATIFVEAHGGDCSYTYAWEKHEQGGPMAESMTFEVDSAGYGAIVGEASVTSAGKAVKVGLHIPSECP